MLAGRIDVELAGGSAGIQRSQLSVDGAAVEGVEHFVDAISHLEPLQLQRLARDRRDDHRGGIDMGLGRIGGQLLKLAAQLFKSLIRLLLGASHSCSQAGLTLAQSRELGGIILQALQQARDMAPQIFQLLSLGVG